MNNSNTSDTIRLDNLTIGYKTHDGIRTVAKDINASIKSGKLTCLVGTNGIGKSTLLRTLSGFQPRLGGSIVINGMHSCPSISEWQAMHLLSFYHNYQA